MTSDSSTPSPILATRVAQTNAEIFPDILTLHVPKGSRVLDMTYGNGVFWKNVPIKTPRDYVVVANDIDPERGTHHEDFTHLPAKWSDSFDAVVLDPPYLGVGGIETLKASIDRSYKNKERARARQAGISAVRRLYAGGIIEAHRVLKRSGVLIVKSMDQVESGQQQYLTHDIMELGRILGFRLEDEFIMVLKHPPTMRHKKQDHARKNHSSFIVMRRRP